MANDINSCHFIGRLGFDPEVKYLPSGKAVTNINIAVGEQWKDKTTGERQERTEWVRCNAFGRLAEIIGEHLCKGSKVYVSGKMRTRKWQDQSGNDRYSTEIIINELQMLDSKGSGQSGSNKGGGSGEPNMPMDKVPTEEFGDIPFVSVAGVS